MMEIREKCHSGILRNYILHTTRMQKLQQLRALTKTTEALEKREAGGALQNLFLLPLCALRSGVASELFDFEKNIDTILI